MNKTKDVKQWYPYADLVIKNANIYTVDVTIQDIKEGNYDFTVIENGFIAVKEGKIIGVDEGDGASFVGAETQIVDAERNTVIPGLLDSHMHALFAGIELRETDCRNCKTLQEMLDLVRERSEREEEGVFLKANRFSELGWEDSAKLDCKALDSVSGEHPVVAVRYCGHCIVANSKAMELAGITTDTPDPDGGSIGRFEDGTPNGWFYEPAGMNLILEHFPAVTERDCVDAIELIGRYLNRVGITSVIDCNLDFAGNRIYGIAKKEGKLSYRTNLTFYIDKAIGDVPYHINRLYEMTAVTGFGDEVLKFNGIKVILDGIPDSGTAYMRKNYKHMPETRGFTTITREELSEICKVASELNWQMAVHAIGDAAVDMTLDAFEAGAEETDNKKNRNYIIHALFPHEDMMSRMRELNVSVALQPTIYGDMGEEAFLDDEYKEINQPCGMFFDNGIICSGGSDFPVVDCNPFIGMATAIDRVCLDGNVYGEQYRINAKQALIMWTMNSAYISSDEEKLGSIEVGKLADLVLIDTPLLESSADKIRSTKVLKTFLGGKLVYKSNVE